MVWHMEGHVIISSFSKFEKVWIDILQSAGFQKTRKSNLNVSIMKRVPNSNHTNFVNWVIL